MSNPRQFLTGRHYGLGGVRDDNMRNVIGNRNLIKATITLEAGDKKDIESQTIALSYTIGGRMYAAAALADLNVTVTDAYNDEFVQAASETCYYALCIDTAGAVTSYKGGSGKGLPGHPANVCCFCLIKVVTGATTFTQGTDNYDKALVTATFYDVACLPASAP